MNIFPMSIDKPAKACEVIVFFPADLNPNYDGSTMFYIALNLYSDISASMQKDVITQDMENTLSDINNEITEQVENRFTPTEEYESAVLSSRFTILSKIPVVKLKAEIFPKPERTVFSSQ